MNVDLLACGPTVVFDEPSENGRPAERREDYDWFHSFADTLPVRVNHLPVITSSASTRSGGLAISRSWTAHRQFRAGLCLVELDDNDISRGLFGSVTRGELWAFSLGGNGKAEVSLTDRPAFTNCRVVGWARTPLPPGNC
jgi:hypothetical protein